MYSSEEALERRRFEEKPLMFLGRRSCDHGRWTLSTEATGGSNLPTARICGVVLTVAMAAQPEREHHSGGYRNETRGSEARSRGHTSAEEEAGVLTRSMSKKQKTDEKEDSGSSEKGGEDIVDKFQEFCKGVPNHLTVVEMRKILEANYQDPSGPDDAVAPRV